MYLYILGFILPWLLFIIFSDKSHLHWLFMVGAFAALLGFIFDSVGEIMKWWKIIDPVPMYEVMFFLDTGFYPVEAMLIVQWLPQKMHGKVFSLLGISLFNTFLEYLLVTSKKAYYEHGWNYGFTLLSYILVFSLIIAYSNVYKHFFHEDSY